VATQQEIIARALAKAQGKATKKANKAKTREESSAKFQRNQATQRRRAREKKLRALREKSGMAIAESFVEEVAPHFLASVKRDDAPKLEGIRVVFRFSKGDQGPYSAAIHSGSDVRNFPNGSIDNLANKHGTEDNPGWHVERLEKKLAAEGIAVKCSTRADWMEEVLRLRQLNKAQQARIETQKGLEEEIRIVRERNNDHFPVESPTVETPAEEPAQNEDESVETPSEPENAADTFDVQTNNNDQDDVETSTEEAVVAPSDVPTAS